MKKNPLSLIALLLLLFASCKKKDDNPPPPPPGGLNSATPVLGFNFLEKINGIWGGPVHSTTLLGDFPDWTMDIRPVSPSQCSGKSELDSLNDLFFNFFLIKHGSDYKIAFRNGGGFAGMQRISYLVCDSVSETATESYYRFSDFVQGTARAYSIFRFKDDSLDLQTFTNKYGAVSPAELHFHWWATLRDSSDQIDAKTQFGAPQKVLVKDFSTTFASSAESIFYNSAGDPYPESQQPFLGRTNLTITYGSSTQPIPGQKSFVLLTTQSLFNGVVYDPSKMKYKSRYVVLDGETNQFSFTYMHPDTYHLLVFHDVNGDGQISSGDYMTSPLSPVQFTLAPTSVANVSAPVNFVIP